MLEKNTNGGWHAQRSRGQTIRRNLTDWMVPKSFAWRQPRTPGQAITIAVDAVRSRTLRREVPSMPSTNGDPSVEPWKQRTLHEPRGAAPHGGRCPKQTSSCLGGEDDHDEGRWNLEGAGLPWARWNQQDLAEVLPNPNHDSPQGEKRHEPNHIGMILGFHRPSNVKLNWNWFGLDSIPIRTK